MRNVHRVWINAPSTLQTVHDYHGMRGIADFDDKSVSGQCVRFYPVSGEVTSMYVDTLYLNYGWPKMVKYSGAAAQDDKHE